MNKTIIEKKAKLLGLKLGCWDEKIENLSKKELLKVVNSMEYQEDTDVLIKRVSHVVEIDIVDNEIDFSLLSKQEYVSRYGNDRYED